MAEIWGEVPDAPLPPPRGREWLRVLRRGLPVVVLTFGGLAVLLAVRVIEAPIHGAHRPWTPRITRFVCRNGLRLMGIRRMQVGAPMAGAGAQVANHSSWLDIFALNAGDLVYFVSKAEVAGWPGIGWLARATGTVFIERRRGAAAAQKALFAERLAAGHRLLFFPEGTSTDGRRVLPFKTTLFAAFTEEGLREGLRIQPVAVEWIAPPGMRADVYGWWGDMGFGAHALMLLAAPPGGAVRVSYGPPVEVGRDRKALARVLEAEVRAMLPFGGSRTPHH